jgi:uncharacterized protein
MRTSAKTTRTPRQLPFELRNSPIQGTGAFATRPIRKGARIIEYKGERVSHDEADSRYEEDGDHPHVVLFVVDKRTVIDAGVGGNEARFINHSCDPNCEAVTEKGHVYLEATRDIAAGEELAYDYHLTRDDPDDEEVEKQFACRCGSRNCRGTMLEPVPRKRKRARRKGPASRRRARSDRPRSASRR